ncbi:IS1182 family transposase [Ktedonospora formicarum]|uniref:IS1182 family transposase n=1 Tax=Ktedonospora formicarum TaxID=2778364 RepID=A0A8J3ICQ1_9CHLR|nr:IS1182 family transposase [Ktedonospora formicarum]GHO50302.1 IS1182 family transposase [Ktedonospora formicarum]
MCASFPKGNLYIHLRDILGTIYQDEWFADLYPGRGQPAYAPWRLALVTVFQFMENLTDRQAADAVRSRLDWKYCLSLELTDAGFDHAVLSEFRTRLVALTAEERFLEAVLDLCKEHGWLKTRGRQRTDSTHVLAKIRALNRAECVVETLRHALNVLSVVTPNWLQRQVQPEWLERYGHRAEEYRFPSGEEEERKSLLHQVGQDGWGLLAAIQADPQNHWMLSIPAVDTLLRVWKQDYLPQEKGGTWIIDEDRLESAKLYFSPYDLDASAATKRSTHWIGYKAHFSETCDEDLPRLITQVTTTIAPTPDRHALPDIHTNLEQRELLPEQHIVDAGYIDAEALVTNQTRYQIDLVGPTAKDYRWQAREQNGYALSNFSIDWANKQARCPQGQISSSWTPTWTRNQEIIKIKFGYATCGRCPVRSQCTKSKQRTLSVRRHEAHFALDAARKREQTEEFKQEYAKRAGVEGVHAQGVRRMGLRRSRYIGEPRTHLQHVVTATAMNVCRLHDWLQGIPPRSTPLSHFARFMKEAA